MTIIQNPVFLKKQDAVVEKNTKSVSKAMEKHLANMGLNKNLDATNLVSYVARFEMLIE